MTAPDPLPGTAVTTYRAFLAAVNARDLEAAAALVDPVRHRENCVGSTRGSVGRASGLVGLGALPWRSVDRPGHGAASASVGGSRAARTAGQRPASAPVARVTARPPAAALGGTVTGQPCVRA